ncbi:MAG: HlyD family secretion protein [Alphaproteobacteria bacterium]|nr:HlyD family secretion protein [Alphaproteobacteria bacterium]
MPPPVKKRIAAVALLLLAIVAASLGYWWSRRHIETTDDAYVASDISVMSAKVPGYVASVEVADNQPVKAGDVLIRLESRDYEAKRDQAQALAQARRLGLAQIEAKLNLQDAQIRQAGAEVAAAAADTQRAKNDLERAQILVKNEFASRQKLDQSQADSQRTAAQLSRARAGADAAKRQTNVLDAEMATARALSDEADAQLELAQIDLENTVIRAPIDGVAANRSAQLGEYVRAGAQLLSIVPLDKVWIEANFKETQLTRMKPGQSVDIKIDAFPDQHLQGKVESIAPASGAKFSLLPPENATGNFTKVVQRVPVRISLPLDSPLKGRIAPGLSAVVKVDTLSLP